MVAARARKIPVIPRAEMLAELMRLKYAVAVAGSHGKTTTTSMVATVLAAAGLDPTAVVGGKVNALGSNAQARQERAAGRRGRRVRRLVPQAAPVDRGGHQHRPRAPRPLRHARRAQGRRSSSSATGCRSTASPCCASTTRTCRRSCRRSRSASSPTAARTPPTTGCEGVALDGLHHPLPRLPARRGARASSRVRMPGRAQRAQRARGDRGGRRARGPARHGAHGARRASAACSGASPCAGEASGHHRRRRLRPPPRPRCAATLAGARRAFGRRARRRLPAAPLHAHPRSARTSSPALQRRRRALRHRHLRRRRGADPRRHRRGAGRGDRARTATAT